MDCDDVHSDGLMRSLLFLDHVFQWRYMTKNIYSITVFLSKKYGVYTLLLFFIYVVFMGHFTSTPLSFRSKYCTFQYLECLQY